MSVASVKNKLGCLPTGCFVAIIMIIVVSIALLLIVRSGIQDAYQKFAADTPAVLVPAPAEISPIALESFNKLKTGCNGETFRFSDADVNYLISHQPELATVKDVVHVDLKGTELITTFAVPLDALSQSPMNAFVGLDLAGKYLNGKAVSSPRYANGQLLLNVQSLEINGEAAPEEGRMAAESWVLKAEILKPGERVSEVRVEEGRLVVGCKP